MPTSSAPSRPRLIAIAVVLLAPPLGARAQASPPPPPSAEADSFAVRVDSLLAPWRGPDRPGCVVGVSRRGRVLLERGYGMADIASGTPMTPATVVHGASLAKSVTAMAVLLLVREGRLTLDDDVRRWLPELPDYAARYSAPLTVRHLLTHTSGLRDVFELEILARGRFEGERITASRAMGTIGRQRVLNFAPGAEYGYSNTGYVLAAHIVSRVSGKPFAAFAAERIFGPLGMTHTRIRDDFAELPPGSARGYAREGAGWRVAVPDYDIVGSTNLQTTVGDQLRWADNLERPIVGDSALVRQMRSPGLLANGDTTRYGLGLSLVRDRGERVVEHEGRDPGYRAYLGRYVE